MGNVDCSQNILNINHNMKITICIEGILYEFDKKTENSYVYDEHIYEGGISTNGVRSYAHGKGKLTVKHKLTLDKWDHRDVYEGIFINGVFIQGCKKNFIN